MTTWAEAHRLGAAAAARLLRKHAVEPHMRTEPLDLAEKEEVLVKFAPLPHLAGAYVCEPDALPGIVVNNRLPRSKQRYTIGHELGHHVFGHATSLDEDTDFLDPTRELTRVPDHEKVAEAFAAWLLMPRSLVESALSSLGIARIEKPSDVYRLALVTGSSYRATCVHLVNLRLITRTQLAALMKVQPRAVKLELLDGIGVVPGAADVHAIDWSWSGPPINAGTGDIVIIRGSAGAPIHLASELPDFATVRQGAEGELCLQISSLSVENPLRRSRSAKLQLSSPDGSRTVEIMVEHPVAGVSERWFG